MLSHDPLAQVRAQVYIPTYIWPFVRVCDYVILWLFAVLFRLLDNNNNSDNYKFIPMAFYFWFRSYVGWGHISAGQLPPGLRLRIRPWCLIVSSTKSSRQKEIQKTSKKTTNTKNSRQLQQLQLRAQTI